MSTRSFDENAPGRSPGEPEPESTTVIPQPTLLRRWFCPDPSTCQRTFVGLALTVLAVAAGLGLTLVIEPDDPSGLFWIVAFFLIGAYIHAWRALWVVYLGTVIPLGLAEVSKYLYLGAAEWEQRNIEHWSGDASPLSKLGGQLIEFAIFGILFALVAGIGALVGYGLRGWWRGFHDTSGPTQSPSV